MRFLKLTNISNQPITRMPGSASMVLTAVKAVGCGHWSAREHLRKSNSAFCLRSSEPWQDVEWPGIRSITGVTVMSTATVPSNGTAHNLRAESLNGLNRRHRVDPPEKSTDALSDSAIDLPQKGKLYEDVECLFPRGFELSDLYPYLSDSQRLVLVVARTISKKFSRGHAVVRKSIHRICHRYHEQTKRQNNRALYVMAENGILFSNGYIVRLLPSAADWLAEQQEAEFQRMQKSAAELSLPLNMTALTVGTSMPDLLREIDRVRDLLTDRT